MSYPLSGTANAVSYPSIATMDSLNAVRNRFRGKALRYSQLLTNALAFRDTGEIDRLAHVFAGCGAMFGYPAVSDAAANLEAYLGTEAPLQWDAVAGSGAHLVHILATIGHGGFD